MNRRVFLGAVGGVAVGAGVAPGFDISALIRSIARDQAFQKAVAKYLVKTELETIAGYYGMQVEWLKDGVILSPKCQPPRPAGALDVKQRTRVDAR